MKIALVHDSLCGLGGAERVFKYMCDEFKEADVFTLAIHPKVREDYFKEVKIHTSWLNPFLRSMTLFRWAFPLSTYVMQYADFSDYDLVLTSSATTAKYIRVPNGKHVCYCYIPTRALWQNREYFGSGFKSKLILPFLKYLRRRDIEAASRVDHFIAISRMTQSEISNIYGKQSEILPSPIDLTKFAKSTTKSENYLIVSRLEKWKRVDFAIEAFNRLGLPLQIVGTGEEESYLKSIAKSNIEFLGPLSDEELSELYAQAKAVIFTPLLEYGLVPLEANACGTPVICLGKGGTCETMIPFRKDKLAHEQSPTAVFFEEQTAESLVAAVHEFEHAIFNPDFLCQHASNWDVPTFKARLRQFVNRVSGL